MENTEEITVENKLDKLEISATIPCVKLLDEHLPLTLNPFYAKSQSNETCETSKLFGSKESDVNNKKQCTCTRRKEDSGKHENVIKSTGTFKSKHKTKRNSFIKEPLLKDIGKCLHHCALALKSGRIQQQKNADDGEIDLSNELKSHLTLSKDGSEHLFGQKESFSDFRTIIEQCSNISLASGSETETTSHDYNQNSFKTLRSRTKESKLRSKTPTRQQNTEAGPSSVSQASTSTSSPNNNSSSSSCSQQARMHCDVTINEIASYFELLYIPKKMSSMAESMYI